MTARLVLLGALAAGAAWGESKMMTWKIDGVERQAIVYAPTAKTPSGKAPLVLAFHGHGDSADNFQGVDLQQHWAQAIVVPIHTANVVFTRSTTATLRNSSSFVPPSLFVSVLR